jgi:CPA2 family monovalent cation:H+ antiporter-2
MFETPFFSEFLVVLIAATGVAFLCERLRIPAVVGFLLAGSLIGPKGLGILSDIGSIHSLAELGMIFLMLTIGLEFSFDRIRGLAKLTFAGGFAQIALTILVSVLFARVVGWSPYEGFILGSVIALSSTAVVLKSLIDRGEVDTQYGRAAVAILIFQDLAVAPLLIFITAFGRASGAIGPTLAFSALKAAGLVAGIVFIARYVLPRAAHWIAASRSREIFLLSAVIVCFGSAWTSHALGLSAALGAFFAGLMLANTDYRYQIIGEIAPFRHIFISIFFVSIGLLFDIGFVLSNLPMVGLVTVLILAVNACLVIPIVMFFGYPPRVAVMAGLVLAQIGEFSFLLLEAGRKLDLLDPLFYQTLLSGAVFTILLTPFLFQIAPVLIRFFERMPFFGIRPAEDADSQTREAMKGHVLLCGYGIAGRDVAYALNEEQVPVVVIDMSPRHVKLAREAGLSALYGDAANGEVLKKAGIERAKAVILSSGDQTALAEIIKLIERMNPEVSLIVRTRFERDVSRLYELGADLVVMEELEVSLELTRAALGHLGVEKEKAEGYMKTIRARKEFLIEQAIFRDAMRSGGGPKDR